MLNIRIYKKHMLAPNTQVMETNIRPGRKPYKPPAAIARTATNGNGSALDTNKKYLITTIAKPSCTGYNTSTSI